MKGNGELLGQAWKIVRTQWLWRLLLVAFVLKTILQLALETLNQVFAQAGVRGWIEVLEENVVALAIGDPVVWPARSEAWTLSCVTACQVFVAYVFLAIVTFGVARVALKSTRDDATRWFASSFGGFTRPLDAAWLMFVMNLRIALWSLLLIVPGVIALYRYRQAWYLMSEHPDWSAGECLAVSGRMMVGHKGQAFLLDLVFFGLMLAAGFALALMQAFNVLGNSVFALIGSLLGILGVMMMMFAMSFMSIGRAVFFRELPPPDAPER